MKQTRRRCLEIVGVGVGVGVAGCLSSESNVDYPELDGGDSENRASNASDNTETTEEDTGVYETSAGEATHITDDLLVEPRVKFRKSIAWNSSAITNYTPDPPKHNYRKLFHAPTGQFLVIIELIVENTSTEDTSFNPNTFDMSNTTQYEDLPATSLENISFEGEPIATISDPITIEPSEQVRLWYLGQCSESNALNPFPLAYTPENESEPQIKWKIKGKEGVPKLKLESVSTPEEVTSGEQFDVQLRVSNTGDGSGRFQGIIEDDALSHLGLLNYNWYESERASISFFNDTIAPGETRNFTSTCVLDVSGIGRSPEQMRINSFETREFDIKLK